MKKFMILIGAIVLSIGVCAYVFKTSASTNNEYKDITFEQYQEKIDKKEDFVVYFHKTGCTACQELSPTLNKVLKKKDKKIYAVELSKYTEKYKDYLVKNNIQSVPTIIQYENGVESKRLGNEIITEDKLNNFFN